MFCLPQKPNPSTSLKTDSPCFMPILCLKHLRSSYCNQIELTASLPGLLWQVHMSMVLAHSLQDCNQPLLSSSRCHLKSRHETCQSRSWCLLLKKTHLPLKSPTHRPSFKNLYQSTYNQMFSHISNYHIQHMLFHAHNLCNFIHDIPHLWHFCSMFVAPNGCPWHRSCRCPPPGLPPGAPAGGCRGRRCCRGTIRSRETCGSPRPVGWENNQRTRWYREKWFFKGGKNTPKKYRDIDWCYFDVVYCVYHIISKIQ